MKRFITVLLVMLAICFCAFSQSKPVVVIVPFDAKNVNKDEVDVISDVFLSEYTATKKATVVDRSSFDKIRAQQKFELSDWSDAGKVAQLGKALNAHQIVTGQISQFGSQLVCTIKLIDVNTTEVISSTVRRVANMDALFNECSKLGQEIAKQASMNVKNYAIGDKGPGGGTVFAIDGDWRWEVSDNLGAYTYANAWNLFQVAGTPYYDWRLPSEAEMREVHNNLVKNGFINVVDDGFRITKYFGYNRHYLFYLKNGWTSDFSESDGDSKYVRLVRKFNVANTSPQKAPLSPVGIYTSKITMGDAINSWGDAWKREFNQAVARRLNKSYELTFTCKVNDNGTYTVEYNYVYADAGYEIDRKGNLKTFDCNVAAKKYSLKGYWKYIKNGDGSKVLPYFSSEDGFGHNVESCQYFQYFARDREERLFAVNFETMKVEWPVLDILYRPLSMKPRRDSARYYHVTTPLVKK